MAFLLQTLKEGFPGTPRFSVDEIPDLRGKVIIVTGGYAGIGKECVKQLLAKNARVYIMGRSKAKGDAAVEELKKETEKEDLHFLELDLADLPSVKRAAEAFKIREAQLHVLINNAGVMVPPIDLVTAQGFDLQFGTNVIGHYLLTNLLLPLMESTAKETGQPGRVIDVSSNFHILSWNPIIKYKTLKDGPARRKMSPEQLYSQSKSGNVLVSKARARNYTNKPLLFISLNPGGIDTDLLRHTPSNIFWGIIRWFLQPISYGALTQLWAATMPEAEKHNGGYLVPWARVGMARSNHADKKQQDQLVAWLEKEIEPYL